MTFVTQPLFCPAPPVGQGHDCGAYSLNQRLKAVVGLAKMPCMALRQTAAKIHLKEYFVEILAGAAQAGYFTSLNTSQFP
jgi:hypothetical protein